MRWGLGKSQRVFVYLWEGFGRGIDKFVYMRQATLFNIDEVPTDVRRGAGGSNNPIVFHDYESYVAKFQNKEKTTDDTYTPPDVYDAVLHYVGTIYDMTGKEVLRPFYPGGDYRHAVYPDDGVVVDNPPFSIFTEICKFYSEAKIPFFLFGPGLTIFSALKYCSVVIIPKHITFSNGAKVQCNFATNLIGDTWVTTAVALGQALSKCKSQDNVKKLKKYSFPVNLVSVSDLQRISRGDEDFSIKKTDGIVCRNLDLFPKTTGLFGPHVLVNTQCGLATRCAVERASAAIPVELSPRERRIIEKLDAMNENKG